MFAKLCAGAALATALLAATSASAGLTDLSGSPGPLPGLQDSLTLARPALAIGASTSRPPIILVPQDASPTPEPDTWALMILGFGAAGGLLRRRRALGALAA